MNIFAIILDNILFKLFLKNIDKVSYGTGIGRLSGSYEQRRGGGDLRRRLQHGAHKFAGPNSRQHPPAVQQLGAVRRRPLEHRPRGSPGEPSPCLGLRLSNTLSNRRVDRLSNTTRPTGVDSPLRTRRLWNFTAASTARSTSRTPGTRRCTTPRPASRVSICADATLRS